MATIRRLTRYEEELGKAVADRLGLDHNTTLMEWDADRSKANGAVWVTMTTGRLLTNAEFTELQNVAQERASTRNE